MKRRKGVVVNVADNRASLLADGGVVEVPFRKVQGADVNEELASLPPSYRLWEEAKRNGTDRGALLGALDAYLAEEPSLGRRRAFAASLLGKGDPEGLGRAGLSDAETNWLRMHDALRAGRGSEALSIAMMLPDGGYPDKALAVAAAWAEGNIDAVDRPNVRRQLAGVSQDPFAALMMLLLDDDSPHPREFVALAQELPESDYVVFDTLAQQEVDDLLLLGRLEPGPDGAASVTRPFSGRAAAFAALTRLRLGVDVAPLPLSATAGLPLELIDDLIEGATVDASSLDELSSIDDAATRRYVTARIAPGALGDADVAGLGFKEEAARRELVSGAVGDGASDCPSAESEAGRQIYLLKRLASGDTQVVAELAQVLPPPLAATAVAVGRSVASGVVDPVAAADRSTWPLLARLVPVDSMRDDSPEVHRFAEWVELAAAQDSLFDWRWEDAIDAARACLRTATDERVRDEALSAMACGLVQSGRHGDALAALTEALEGLDSPGLIVNYSLVAALVDPLAAARELGRLAYEAPTLELRVTAAEQAMRFWRASPPGTERDELPESLLLALRSLSVEPTGLEHHRNIMFLLSWADSEWLADPRHTFASPYRDTAQHKYYVARGEGPTSAAREMARLLADDPESSWLLTERDETAAALMAAMLGDGGNVGAAAWANAMLEHGVPLDALQRAPLAVLAVREILRFLAESGGADDGAPVQALFDRLVTARRDVLAWDEPDDALLSMVDATINVFALLALRGWSSQYDNIARAYNLMLSQIRSRPRYQINMVAVRNASHEMAAALAEIEACASAVLPYLTDDGLASAVEALRQEVVRARSLAERT